MAPDEPARWIFEHLTNDRWRWQLARTDHYPIRSPDTHPGLSAAISDAMASGFSPKNDRWMVDDRSYTTHYEPGRNPETIPKPDPIARQN